MKFLGTDNRSLLLEYGSMVAVFGVFLFVSTLLPDCYRVPLMALAVLSVVGMHFAISNLLEKKGRMRRSARIRTLAENARRIAEGRPSVGLTGTEDEFSSLEVALKQLSAAAPSQRSAMRSFSRKAADVICALDRQFKFISVNPASKVVWQYRQEELLGHPLSEFVHEPLLVETQEFLENSRTSSTPVWFENVMKCGTGRDADMLWSASWSEQDKAYCCVVHDITETKDVERLKRDFVQMISHDLRTPLSSLSNTLTMMIEGLFGELNESGMKTALASKGDLERLIRLVNGLLDIDKMEEKKMELALEPFDIAFLVEHSFDAVEGFAQEREIRLVTNCPGCELLVDADRIVQVLVNLLSNAIKFSRPGSVVTVGGALQERAFVVKVADSGIGIPADQIGRVFDKFRQVQSAEQKKQKGSGLGLAICKTVVEEHGGQIGVNSQPGVGSTFWFSLPLPEA